MTRENNGLQVQSDVPRRVILENSKKHTVRQTPQYEAACDRSSSSGRWCFSWPHTVISTCNRISREEAPT